MMMLILLLGALSGCESAEDLDTDAGAEEVYSNNDDEDYCREDSVIIGEGQSQGGCVDVTVESYNGVTYFSIQRLDSIHTSCSVYMETVNVKTQFGVYPPREQPYARVVSGSPTYTAYSCETRI